MYISNFWGEEASFYRALDKYNFLKSAQIYNFVKKHVIVSSKFTLILKLDKAQGLKLAKNSNSYALILH